MLNDNKQALETLKVLCLCGICTTGDCPNCDRYNAKNRAVEALEKQIPKKPIKDNPPSVRYMNTYTCAACNKVFSGKGIAQYCYHCGQRLDWDD